MYGRKGAPEQRCSTSDESHASATSSAQTVLASTSSSRGKKSSSTRNHTIPTPSNLSRGLYRRIETGRMSDSALIDESPMSYDITKDLQDPDFDIALTDPTRHLVNWRGICNTLALVVLICILLGLFMALPIGLSVSRYMRPGTIGGAGGRYTSPTTTVPLDPGGRLMLDPDTPVHERTRTSMEGETWQLVFSDEFNKPGRTFRPGDDPFWEAVDLHYWATSDYEWYSPEQITTVEPGYLQITMEKRRTHNLNYVSGMLQSWDKLCFTGGIMEVNVSLPGPPNVPGLWPGAWMLGNLARAGYGATTDGVWPYSYDSCDVGVTRNQSKTMKSYLPGQRLNKCTCPSHVTTLEHPSPGKGRGAPEIDVIEATGADDKFGTTQYGSVSQSVQFAPFDKDWQVYKGGYKITNTNASIGRNGRTIMNPYRGSEWQEAVSALTQLDGRVYDGRRFQTYAVEYVPSRTPGKKAYIRWLVDGKETWRMWEDAVRPNKKTRIGQRFISMEPMSLIFNFGMSTAFGPVDLEALHFPAHYLIDYVRFYQSPDRINVDCSPPDFPTAEYIKHHYNAYTNPNLTTFEQAGYSFPPFSVHQQC